MKSKQQPITILGQRSITSSLIPRSSNPLKSYKEDVTKKEASAKDSKVSLSDFLGRKLGRSSDRPKTVQGKTNPFSLVSPIKLGGSKKGDARIDKVVFEKFKHTSNTEKVDSCIASSSCNAGKGVDCFSVNDVQESRNQRNPFEGWHGKNTAQKQVLVLGDNCSLNNVQVSRKRSNPFEGGSEKHVPQNHMLVLGDDPRPTQTRTQTRLMSRKKPKPLYNHYKNGSGWWGSDMEGVASEEVGVGEVWEGVGATTYGGVDWH